MKTNTFKKRMEDGKRGVIGWISTPNAFQAEAYASAGWDAVTIDMQHGASDTNDLIGLMQAICLNDVMPLVRVPWNDPSYIMRALDCGAMGIICPMVNTVAEAEALVRSGRYPPMGARSNGPFRAAQWAGADYVAKADHEHLDYVERNLADIESRRREFDLVDALRDPAGDRRRARTAQKRTKARLASVP